MEYKLIKPEKIQDFVNALIANGKQVLAPKQKKDKVFFSLIRSFDEIAMDFIQTAFSAKSAVFPKCEELYSFEKNGKDTILNNPPAPQHDTVVFGMRPCDGAAFDYLATFFLKENPDYHFKMRYDKTILIGLTCPTGDEFCFCTSVGISPSDTRGSDLLLTKTENGYFVEIITEKGKKLVEQFSDFFEQTNTIDKTKYTANIQKRFDSSALKEKINGVFNWERWEETSLPCFGCGTCAFSCPTCTCFDIQDEANLVGGARYRIWDTCALGIFTKHASGHNPREKQSERWRNRILHKFLYTDEQFGTLSCVGCGRCIRNCPAELSIIEQVNAIMEG